MTDFLISDLLVVDPSPTTPTPPIPPQDLSPILRYLSLPPSYSLPTDPIQFLTQSLPILPYSLLKPIAALTTPRQRSVIPLIKSRRLAYISLSPLPKDLTAKRGRLRWPLLWERMGGDPLDLVEDEESDGEEDWVAERFLPGEEGRQHVKKLGGFLRGLDLERGAEKVREARRRERVLDMKGQEFEEGEDVVEPGMRKREMDREERGREEWKKEEIERRFEKRLSVLFLDGYDTIDYDPIDLSEPLEGDILLYQDEQENYFDDESPSGTPHGSTYDDEELKTPRDSIHQDGELDNSPQRPIYPRYKDETFFKTGIVGGREEKEMGSQNGQGEYDY